MYNKTSFGLGIHVRRFIAYFVLIVLSFLCLFWFYVLLINSSRNNAEIQLGFSAWFGKDMLVNLKNMAKFRYNVFRGLLNSFIIASASSVLCTYFSAMTAYAIHAYDFKAKNAIFTFILMIMTIPTQVTALGFIQLVDKMGLMNNFTPLIVPSIAAPVTFFYMKQYMESALPLAFVEAARIDGSGEFHTFNMIVIPMMKPAIAVQAIFAFVASWNNYFTPALILKTDKVRTLPIIMALLRSMGKNEIDLGLQYMVITFSIFPVIIVYLFLSKFIVQGVALGGVKG